METENEYNVDVINHEDPEEGSVTPAEGSREPDPNAESMTSADPEEGSVTRAEGSREPDLNAESMTSGVDTSQVRIDSIHSAPSIEPEGTVINEHTVADLDERVNSENFEEMDAAGADFGSEQATTSDDFDPLFALTKLLVGAAIEGPNQLTKRLKFYEEELRREAEERAAEGLENGTDEIEEDELTRLRYALVGFIFDAQASLRKNVTLWAKLADRSLRATNQISQPVASSFLFRPFTRRYEKMVRRGEESLARWIAEGRSEEQPSRDLALRTYEQIVGEFIDRLAENPELQAVITKQSISVASDMRDEVRERTVTADNLIESLVRRVLRRTPRAELPSPPPQVQRWAGLTLEEYRSMKLQSDEGTDKQSP